MQVNTNKYFKLFKIEKISELTPQEFKRRYRILAMKYHPDKGGNQRHFTFVLDAYNYLKKLMKEHLKKENKKFYNKNFVYYSNGSIYDKKSQRWIKIKGTITSF